jgi:hypothetical protein
MEAIDRRGARRRMMCITLATGFDAAQLPNRVEAFGVTIIAFVSGGDGTRRLRRSPHSIGATSRRIA